MRLNSFLVSCSTPAKGARPLSGSATLPTRSHRSNTNPDRHSLPPAPPTKQLVQRSRSAEFHSQNDVDLAFTQSDGMSLHGAGRKGKASGETPDSERSFGQWLEVAKNAVRSDILAAISATHYPLRDNYPLGNTQWPPSLYTRIII